MIQTETMQTETIQTAKSQTLPTRSAPVARATGPARVTWRPLPGTGNRSRMIPIVSAAVCVWFAASIARTHAATVIDSGQSPVTLPAGPKGGEELSAIAFQSGTRWLVLGDHSTPSARLLEATIEIDPDSARIVGAPSLNSAIPLEKGKDTEGLAITGDGGFLISDEVGPAIHRFGADGKLLGTIPVPPVFRTGLRGNLGFESLAIGPDGSIWTANEEALRSDGPTSSFTEGTIVRIQRFDPAFAPSGQWGYVTERIPGEITGTSSGRDLELSGVVDMSVLPDGTLLILERAFGGDPQAFGLPVFEIRIYEVSLVGATDTSALPKLSKGSFVPARKTRLWEGRYGFASGLADFEGLALGPSTTDGDLIAVLVADNNGGTSQQVLKTLRIRMTPPSSQEPDGSQSTREDEGPASMLGAVETLEDRVR